MDTTTPTATANTGTLVLMMGAPASGKGFIRTRDYANLPVVDSDAIKATHPDYDPSDAAGLHVLHPWSSREATKALYAALSTGDSVVFDGTGAKAEKHVGFANAAHAAGYRVELCYVTVDLATSLRRNAARERTVDESVVRDLHASVAISFDIVSRYVDSVRVVHN